MKKSVDFKLEPDAKRTSDVRRKKVDLQAKTAPAAKIDLSVSMNKSQSMTDQSGLISIKRMTTDSNDDAVQAAIRQMRRSMRSDSASIEASLPGRRRSVMHSATQASRERSFRSSVDDSLSVQRKSSVHSKTGTEVINKARRTSMLAKPLVKAPPTNTDLYSETS